MRGISREATICRSIAGLHDLLRAIHLKFIPANWGKGAGLTRGLNYLSAVRYGYRIGTSRQKNGWLPDHSDCMVRSVGHFLAQGRICFGTRRSAWLRATELVDGALSLGI